MHKRHTGSIIRRITKRPIDIVGSVVLLIITSPILLITAVAIKVSSKGPIFFRQQRIGWYLHKFVIYKFRSFKTTVAFDIDNPVIRNSDVNVTKLGKIIRRLKIDELPQLFNILKGDMSFVGPRPVVDTYLTRYNEWELAKYAVRPGITGLGQVKGNGELTREHRSYYDIVYLQKGLWSDLVIVLKSFLVVILGEKRFYREPNALQMQQLQSWTRPNDWDRSNRYEQKYKKMYKEYYIATKRAYKQNKS